MKTRNTIIGWVAVMAALTFTSCENSLFDQKDKEYGILPEHFKVDIPSSLSNDSKSAELKSTAIDTVNGNVIYWHLNTFIAVGEGAADIVEAAIWYISTFNIEDVISLSYTSEEDNRVKNLDVIADVSFRERQWQYQLTLTDAASEGNADRGIGMQIFWNTDPVEGIAIFKPYNMNRTDHSYASNAMCSIEYSEAGTGDYEATMLVEIAGLPVSDDNPFALETLKMFVGKNGNIIDVFGNSNHPNARFNAYDQNTKGFNWAFVAAGDRTNNVAVAEVGLPLSQAELTSRTSILVDNSIKTVLTREMTNYVVAAYASVGITLQPAEVAAFISPYLKNADAPGYFDHNGFIKGGTAPDNKYAAVVESIGALVPYTPSEVSNLQIDFGN